MQKSTTQDRLRSAKLGAAPDGLAQRVVQQADVGWKGQVGLHQSAVAAGLYLAQAHNIG
ncbi:MAG: hypothetical protein N838_30280 [Thiohalocapsa sp. PB-PSB1]|nr:MAG: hypothetical protein N838_30280 [Thiohalocapsa sp. PB-PSB1]